MARAPTTRPTNWWRPRPTATATPATSPATRCGRAPRCTPTPRSARSATPATPASSPAMPFTPARRSLRELPQVHHHLVHGQGRPCHLQRRHQLRVLPQRHRRRDGQEQPPTFRSAIPTALPATARRSPGSRRASTTPRSPSRPSAPPATPAPTRRPMARARNHTPYQLVSATSSANCDTCHKSGYAVWTGAKVHSNANITTQCATCHAGIKPNNATTRGQTTCEGCHKSTSTWSAGKVDHSTFTAATNCANVPQRQRAASRARTATHVPVGSTNCYRLPQPYQQPGSPALQPHPGHRHGPVRHLPHRHLPGGRWQGHQPHALPTGQRHGSSANCDTCHKSGYAVWTGAKVHSNANITTQCADLPRQHQAQQHHARRADGVRGLPQVHQPPGPPRSTTAASTRPPTAPVPQRQRRHGQEQPPTCRWAAPTAIACHSTTAPGSPPLQPHPGAPSRRSAPAATPAPTRRPMARVPRTRPTSWSAPPPSANCDTCHKSGYTLWTPAPRCTQRHHHGAVRHLPRQHQAQQRHARGPDRLRGLSQVHQHLVQRQGRPHHLRCGHQLRFVPQRHWRRHRQEQRARTGGQHQLLRLPQPHQALEAQWLQPHPGAGDGAVRHLPHRHLPGGRWQARQPHAVSAGGGHRFGQLRHLPQVRLHAVDGRQGAPTPRSRRSAPPATPASSPTTPRTRARRLRGLPQVHQHLVRRQGGPHHLRRGHQLQQRATTARAA
jgi:hypothetical protein